MLDLFGLCLKPPNEVLDQEEFLVFIRAEEGLHGFNLLVKLFGEL